MTAANRRRPAPGGTALAAGLAEVLAEVLQLAGCRPTRTSSTTSAPTRWSWPSSAPASASAPTCPRCRSRTSTGTRRSRGLAAALAPPQTANRLERAFAESSPRSWTPSRSPADAHFFDDLGADSMVMAQFCARVRKRADLPSVSIKDVYPHPTITRLAAALAPPHPGRRTCRRPRPVAVPRRRRRRPRTARYVVCGAAAGPGHRRVRRLAAVGRRLGLHVDLGRRGPARHLRARGRRRRRGVPRRLRRAGRREVGGHRAVDPPARSGSGAWLRPVLGRQDR